MAVKKVTIPELGTVHLYKRRGVKGMRLSVTSYGLVRVSLPNWIPYASAVAFVLQKREWIQSQQIRRRPEIALLLTIVQIAFMLGPFLIVLSSIWAGFGRPQLIALTTCVLLTLTNITIVHITSPVHTLIAVFNLPITILVELGLGITSMLKYEFSAVEWKGRNVCIPVMHVIPRLPGLDQKK